jgi:multidrug efflux pump subunit AcrA (membrane-fusion protein)
VSVLLDALDQTLEGTVSQVIPAADPGTRTALVRVDLPRVEGLRTGQFGRMRVAIGTRSALIVPIEAVVRVGGLDSVRVVGQDGRQAARYVRVGAEIGAGRIEVLSGLAEGERVALTRGTGHE